MSSSNSPCGACQFLRRECTQECVLAPYFPSDDPQKFECVHKVFGASNVANLLSDLNVAHRRDAVESLAFEAEVRLGDPVHGCLGLISALEHKIRQVRSDIFDARTELSTYIGPQAMLPMIQPTHSFMPQHYLGDPSSSDNLTNLMNLPMMGTPTHGVGEPQQQQPQMYELQGEQEMLRAYVARKRQKQRQQHRQQQEFGGFNHNSEVDGSAGSVTVAGFNQMNTAAAVSPSLAIGTFDNQYQSQPQQQQENQHHSLQEQILFQTPQPQEQPQQKPPPPPPQHERPGSDEGRSGG